MISIGNGAPQGARGMPGQMQKRPGSSSSVNCASYSSRSFCAPSVNGGAGDGRVPDGYQIPEKSGCGVWATLGSEKRSAAASPAPHVKARDGRPIGIRLTPFLLIQVRGERVIRLAAPGPPSG